MGRPCVFSPMEIALRNRLQGKRRNKANREYFRKWRAEHKEEQATYKRQWQRDNADSVNRRCREYTKRRKPERCARRYLRYRTDISFRLRKIVSSRIRHALQGRGKGHPSKTLLGCTIEYLKEYLELKFQNEMSWINYGRGGWHVDHIIPCSAFDLSDDSQLAKCFHYSNLQPLWEKDNLRKGASCNSI